MKNILIFSGTTEGRKLSELLCENEISHIVSVATEYGRQVCNENSYARIIKGRMDLEMMKKFLSEENIDLVIDATHPYAKEVTVNIKNAVSSLDNAHIKYMRYVRDIQKSGLLKNMNNIDSDIYGNINHEDDRASDTNYNKFNVCFFSSSEECEKALKERAGDIKGNILLTTGSKELSVFCTDEDIRKRLIARVLPGAESIALCEENGLSGRQIIAMQGPFSEDMNAAIIRQYDISCMVTKQSGANGGFEEKLMAAKNEGIPVYVIGCPVDETGHTLEEILSEIGISYSDINTEKNIVADSDESIEDNKCVDENTHMNIRLIGVGMGAEKTLTVEAKHFIESSDIILGAERIIAPFEAKIEKKPYYLAKDIIPYLKKTNGQNISILLSGDSGFYSGCEKLYKALQEAVEEGSLNANIEIIPGISSVSYLASKLGQSWSDAKILSIHGRRDVTAWKGELKYTVRHNYKTFILLSGVKNLNDIIGILKNDGLENCRLFAGYQMSYDNEKIIEIDILEAGDITDRGTSSESNIAHSNYIDANDKIKKVKTDEVNALEDGLYTCLIINPEYKDISFSSYIADSEFERGNVPMTKEEIRSLSIAKLNLDENSVVYDIGSGTGSIAVQIGSMSDKIKVYAIERKKEAVDLIRKNCEKFDIDNVEIIEGFAPECLEGLVAPTHAFIGGSGGHMKEILTKLFEKNPHMSVVINAVSTETMQQCMELEKVFKLWDFSMVQLAVTRLNHVGEHHLLKSENPIWICSFKFTI